MPGQIAFASQEDADEIATLVNRAYRPASGAGGWTHEAEFIEGSRTSKQQVLTSINNGVVILTLRKSSSIVACVQVAATGSVASIAMLATEPALQGMGCATVMLQKAESYASGVASVTCFRIDVIEGRTELVAFYERRGYKLTGNAYYFPQTGEFGIPLVERMRVLEMTKEIAK
jgi:GNAT superfamily N-acetyltransferase